MPVGYGTPDLMRIVRVGDVLQGAVAIVTLIAMAAVTAACTVLLYRLVTDREPGAKIACTGLAVLLAAGSTWLSYLAVRYHLTPRRTRRLEPADSDVLVGPVDAIHPPLQ